MRLLIVGAGRIGMHLIGYLSSSDENQLTVIEKKGEQCKAVAEKYDATILNDDGSKLDVMKKADASQSDLLVAATDDDRVNLAISRAAKKEFGVPRVIAVANSPRNKTRLIQAGADVVICPIDLALRDFENVLSKDHSITLMYRAAENLRVAEAVIPVNASLIGKKFHEIQLPEKCKVGLVCRDNGFVFPEPELELKSGDKVLLLGEAESVAKTVELLRSSESA
ncbi:MAG TPA: TrkA family potassium uptake protein [Candidatus Bathyarchaeia archaeon]|nr:TrkA family potassium uptake protein [Candidatus Bathyarchaeia archaeon]